MSVPCNAIDFARFQKLAEALAAQKPPVEMNIWARNRDEKGKSWISLEIRGELPAEVVASVFGITTAEDELAKATVADAKLAAAEDNEI